MNPRQPPQHPFSRNTTSPYGRTPFPPASSQPSFPPTSQPPPGTAPSYLEHNRRPSEPSFYNQQRYGQDGPPMSGPSHSRHQSASSVGHGTPVNRMPPPSPQQPSQQAPHLSYGPPPPRAPPTLGPPSSSFTSSRELPTLPPLGRPPSNGVSSMSISSMLGGAPVSREAPSQYASPVVTSAPTNSIFGSTHASPRMNTTASEYAPFRRPQTPEHQQPFTTRDHRANSAGSPPNLGHYTTPESQRFGTPQQSYQQRAPLVEEIREPMRVPNPNAMPPRPNSQPAAFGGPASRMPDNSRPPPHNDSIFGRRVDNAQGLGDRREQPSYNRPYEDRYNLHDGFLERAERERQQERARDTAMLRDREIALQRERDQREQRERAEHENMQRGYAQQLAQRNAQQAAYNRQPDPREHHPQWMQQPNYERPPYNDQQPPERPPPQQGSNGYAYPSSSTASQYSSHPAYTSNEPRYGQAPPATSMPPTSHYEESMQERQRFAQQQEQQRQQVQQQQQSLFGGPPQNGQYQPHESPARRPIDESHPMQQNRNSLAVQEINRRGRISPLPQPVQGAQGQSNGQSGEPSIKNEFGRMFSGIGSGVGAMERAMSGPSPIISGPQIPFSNPGGLRREDLESLQDGSPGENGGPKMARRTSSRGGRRRKLKDEPGDDESSTGRQTPSGRGKRAKLHHPHHHHHHRLENGQDNASSPVLPILTPFRSIKGTIVPSPPNLDPQNTGPLHHHHIPRHHHHHVTPAKPAPQVNTVIPLQKTVVRNNAVLDMVARLPRRHLGHAYYKSTLKPIGTRPKRDFAAERGFASTPEPLPKFEGCENCTFTIRVPRSILEERGREEITSRRAVWGTDVYTDDSDVVAACIHGGWFRGAWPEDVDIELLDLDVEHPTGGKWPIVDVEEIIREPPPGGPMEVPVGRDLQVTVVVLPTLEKYASKTRWGIKSREWGGERDGWKSVHDGLSFMILSIRWINSDGVERGGGGKKLFSIDQGLDDGELEEEKHWAGLFNQKDGETNGQFKESFERGGLNEKNGDIKGIGMKSWWKDEVLKEKKADDVKAAPVVEVVPPIVDEAKVEEAKPEATESEIAKPEEFAKPEPEIPIVHISVEQEHDIEMVTERMIHNAHTREKTAPLPPPRVESLTPPPMRPASRAKPTAQARDPDVPIPSVERR